LADNVHTSAYSNFKLQKGKKRGVLTEANSIYAANTKKNSEQKNFFYQFDL